MGEKELLEMLRDDYAVAHPDDAAAVDRFCGFARKWLGDNPPAGFSYTVDGMTVRLANGDSYLLTRAPGADSDTNSVSVTGVAKLNARGFGEKPTDFPITGR